MQKHSSHQNISETRTRFAPLLNTQDEVFDKEKEISTNISI